MNFWMKMLLGDWNGVHFAAADEGAGGAEGNADGGAGANDQAAADAAAALAGGAGDGSGTDNGGLPNAGAEGGDVAPPEFVADPTKTPAENEAAKADHDKKVADDKAEAERADFFGAPEKYADLVIPEGLNLDQEAANGIFELGKKLNFSQKTIDALIDVQKGIYARSAEEGTKAWVDTVKSWTDEVKGDKDIGGKNYDANMGLAASARATFGTPEFGAWLDETQLGSHPEVTRFLVAVGQAMGEAKTLQGGKQNDTVDAGELLYDHPSSKVGK